MIKGPRNEVLQYQHTKEVNMLVIFVSNLCRVRIELKTENEKINGNINSSFFFCCFLIFK